MKDGLKKPLFVLTVPKQFFSHTEEVRLLKKWFMLVLKEYTLCLVGNTKENRLDYFEFDCFGPESKEYPFKRAHKITREYLKSRKII